MSSKAVREWINKFCPTCKKNFGRRTRALQLQAAKGEPITKVIIEAGRDAFDSCYGPGSKEGRDVIERFRTNLGVTRSTLHDWLRFFFGLDWPDWKRKYICAAHCCSIVDVSAVETAGRFSKYYPIVKLRQKGTCACSIKGDQLILVDAHPEELTPAKLTQKFRRHLPWFDGMCVITGSHLDLLPGQEDT